ncbi:unnamed protein product, partial [Meganyctiphanes norvegica]
NLIWTGVVILLQVLQICRRIGRRHQHQWRRKWLMKKTNSPLQDPMDGAVTGIGTPPDTPGEAPETQVFTRSDTHRSCAINAASLPRSKIDLVFVTPAECSEFMLGQAVTKNVTSD